MRLTASDIISNHRPTVCDLRVWLRHRNEPEREASPFEEILHRLGERHEKECLASLGACSDFSKLNEAQRLQSTSEAIANRVSVLYQPTFLVKHAFGATEVEILGIPDFLLFEGQGYVIRDAKMARRIDEENHPEIILQVQLYGWLFQRACGVAPKALQVFSGTEDIVSIPFDGGAAALVALERLLGVQQGDRAYEPVGWSKCSPCGYVEHCWKQAEQNKDVALVPGVDQSIARKLNGIGVNTWEQLLTTFDAASLSELKHPVGAKEYRIGKSAERILQFARAMEMGQERILASPAIPSSPNYVMFDLEGMPPHLDEIEKIYLWGIRVYGEKSSEFMPAVAGFEPDGDRDGWLAFLSNAKKVFDACGNVPFVHWALYEKTKLNLYIARYGDPEGIAARVKANLLDLLTVARESIVLPIPSFSLKVVEKYVGFKRTLAEAGGQWAIATFIEATETSDEGKRKELMGEILKYNEEDLSAMWAVFQWLQAKVSLGS